VPLLQVRPLYQVLLPFPAAHFDLVVLMHALTYAEQPAQAVTEAGRVLRPGGLLLLTSLAKHEHRGPVEAFGHVNLGFAEKELQKLAAKGGLDVISCETVTRERRPPHFEVIALIARKAIGHGSAARSPASRNATAHTSDTRKSTKKS